MTYKSKRSLAQPEKLFKEELKKLTVEDCRIIIDGLLGVITFVSIGPLFAKVRANIHRAVPESRESMLAAMSWVDKVELKLRGINTGGSTNG